VGSGFKTICTHVNWLDIMGWNLVAQDKLRIFIWGDLLKFCFRNKIYVIIIATMNNTKFLGSLDCKTAIIQGIYKVMVIATEIL
jgi:hypothetical protein